MEFRWVDGEDELLCERCSAEITLEQYRQKQELCDDCRIAELTPPDWLDVFLVQLDAWDYYRHHAPRM